MVVTGCYAPPPPGPCVWRNRGHGPSSVRQRRPGLTSDPLAVPFHKRFGCSPIGYLVGYFGLRLDDRAAGDRRRPDTAISDRNAGLWSNRPRAARNAITMSP